VYELFDRHGCWQVSHMIRIADSLSSAFFGSRNFTNSAINGKRSTQLSQSTQSRSVYCLRARVVRVFVLLLGLAIMVVLSCLSRCFFFILLSIRLRYSDLVFQFTSVIRIQLWDNLKQKKQKQDLIEMKNKQKILHSPNISKIQSKNRRRNIGTSKNT